jgi:phosphatidylethanolamine-binding protein (PEBP) family uncharacterized protein
MNLIYQHPVTRFICLLFSIFTVTPALAAEGEQTMTLNLKSPDFVHLGEIPKVLTCQDDDSSPALNWSEPPQNTKSLVLIVDDPDAPDPAAPKMTWVHWLIYPCVAQNLAVQGGDVSGSDLLASKYALC